MFGSESMSKFTPLLPVSSLGSLSPNIGSSVTPVEMTSYQPVTAFGLVSSLAGPMPTPLQLQHHSTDGSSSNNGGSNGVGGHPPLQRPVPKHSAGLTLKMPYPNQVHPLQPPHSHHQQQHHQLHSLQSDQHQHQQQKQQHNAHNNHNQQQQSTLQLSSPDGSSSNQASSPPDMSDNLSTTSSSSGDHPCNASGSGSGQFKRKGKGVPYIPSYMDLSNGPEPCVVCGDAATGYHYRCMTCEGCKGFFRRTIQKNLQYHCKWNKNCVIDKTTRNQCQECRFIKCLNVGMATDLVLNEKQRTAKRKLIEDNRVRRKEEVQKIKPRETAVDPDALTDQDRGLICEVVTAYEYTAGKIHNLNNKGEYDGVSTDLQSQDPESWQQLAEAMTPSIIKVVEFAKSVPGFTELNVDDQILLLKSCCMEIMCLRAACRFDPAAETLTLHNGIRLHKSQIHQGGLAVLIEPIFDFAIGLAKLQLDKAETALLASILLMQSDRSGLKDPESVERLQDAILGAFKRYVAENRPHQPVHWAKILMKVTDLRTISTRHAERVLCIRLDNSGEIPPLLLEVFNEGHSIS